MHQFLSWPRGGGESFQIALLVSRRTLNLTAAAPLDVSCNLFLLLLTFSCPNLTGTLPAGRTLVASSAR